MTVTADPLPDDVDALKAALLAERATRREMEARASGGEAMVAHLKLLIPKMKRDCFGASRCSSKTSRQLQLMRPKRPACRGARRTCALHPGQAGPSAAANAFATRAVVLPSPSSCSCCGGKLAKLGETIIETLESIPRTYKVIQTVREKFSCRACESITQPPAPFHPIARGRAGPDLLATVLYGKFGEHQPLNRQSEGFARESLDLSVSTLADCVGACTASLMPLVLLIRAHVLAAERLLHGDDTTVPVLPKTKP